MRLMGWWTCVIALAGPAVVSASAGPVAGIAVMVLWAAPVLWLGWRHAQLGVFEGSDVLVVRNPLRTHRVRYVDIDDITIRQRHAPSRFTAPLVALFNRSVGVIEVDDGLELIEMRTTESLWPVTLWLSRSRDQSATDIARIRAAWLARVGGHR